MSKIGAHGALPSRRRFCVFWESAVADQTELEQRIVYGDYNGVAKIPIRFNSNHPDERFRNRAYLPCSVLKKKIGNPDMTHYLYLLVMFYDVTDVGNYKVFHFAALSQKSHR